MNSNEEHLQLGMEQIKKRLHFGLGQRWDSHIEWENHCRQMLRWIEAHEKRLIPEKAKVIPLNCVTKLDLPANRILEAAIDKLEGVVISGKALDGTEWFASSYADGGDALWYLERMKYKLITTVD